MRALRRKNRRIKSENLQVGALAVGGLGDRARRLNRASDSASRRDGLPAPPPGGSPDRLYNMFRDVSIGVATELGVPSLARLPECGVRPHPSRHRV
jgi:hypothetical protein